MTGEREATSMQRSMGIDALAGALAGSFLLAVVQLVLDLLFARSAFRDGQYLFTYFVWTMPFGALAGGMALAAGSLVERSAHRSAAMLCVGGGCLLGLTVAAVIPQWDFRSMPVVAAFYVVSVCLIAAGIACFRESSRRDN